MARTKDFNELEVLNKAITIFRDRGYNGTSMESLVNGLGISRSSLYDTYGDKHSLFIKALKSYQTKASQRMNAILYQATTSKEAIKQMLELTKADMMGDLKQNGCFWINAEVELVPHDQEIESMVAQYGQQVENIFYRALKKGQDCGEIPKYKDTKAISGFLFNTIKGLSITARSKIDNCVFDDTIKLAMSVID